MQLEDRGLKTGLVMDGIDLSQERHCRSKAQLIDLALVHAGAIVVAHKLLDAAALPVGTAGNVVKDRFQLILGVFASFPAAAPAIHIRRNRILLSPGTVCILEEVVARSGGTVKVVRIDSMLTGALGK